MLVLGLIGVLLIAAVAVAAAALLRAVRGDLVSLRLDSGNQLAERNAEVDRRLGLHER